MTDESPSLFLGAHPALDFLNTTYLPGDRAVERIGDGRAFLRWLVEAGAVDESTAVKLRRRFGAEALDAAAQEARRFRSWATAWIEQWAADPEADYAGHWHRLNGLLARGHGHLEAVETSDGWTLVERAHFDSASELIALVAASIARLLAGEAPQRVRRCAGADCTLWFLDRTKAHSRQFCSAASCGNRAKVAAFRRRQRA